MSTDLPATDPEAGPVDPAERIEPAAPIDVATTTPPDRPRGVVGSVLVVVGALVIGAGPFLDWFRLGDIEFDGFSEIEPRSGAGSLGVTFVALAVVLAALGDTTLLARRILPLVIAAGVVATVVGVAAIDKYAELRADLDGLDGPNGIGELGPGLPMIVVGATIALVGSIVLAATRRRRT